MFLPLLTVPSYGIPYEEGGLKNVHTVSRDRTPRAVAKDKEKLKKNEMHLTGQTVETRFCPKNPVLRKVKTAKEDRGNLDRRGKSPDLILMNYHNLTSRSGRPSEELPTATKHKQFCGAAEGILGVFLTIEEVHKRSHRDPSHQAKRRRINKGVYGSP
ncbi:hypothetical protein Tco_1475154 [Tanacetum coccineum]